MNDLRESSEQVEASLEMAHLKRGSLGAYEGKRVAVIVGFGGTVKPLCGLATYGDDPDLGRALKIHLDGDHQNSGGPEIFISESQWDGRVSSGAAYGCDICFTPSPFWPPG
jgi:hypothetical protein